MIIEITNPSEKSRIVEQILSQLPDWFGLPESTQEYIDQAQSLPLWAAKTGEQVLGIITLQTSSATTTEIHCLGVRPEYHRHGLGRQLIETAIQALDSSQKLLQVKTVAPGHYDCYDRTHDFYLALGFYDLEVFPDMWDPWNPCLIMVRPL